MFQEVGVFALIIAHPNCRRSRHLAIAENDNFYTSASLLILQQKAPKEPKLSVLVESMGEGRRIQHLIFLQYFILPQLSHVASHSPSADKTAPFNNPTNVMPQTNVLS